MTKHERQREHALRSHAQRVVLDVNGDQADDGRPHHRLEQRTHGPHGKEHWIGTGDAHDQIAQRCAGNAREQMTRGIDAVDDGAVDQLAAGIYGGEYRLQHAALRHGEGKSAHHTAERSGEVQPAEVGRCINGQAGEQKLFLRWGKRRLHAVLREGHFVYGCIIAYSVRIFSLIRKIENTV